MNYTDEQIEELLKGIYEGTYTPRKMPLSLYNAIAEYLKKAAYEGFGGGLDDLSGMYLDAAVEIRENIYLFSGAKTFQYTKESAALITDATGTVKSFSRFMIDALPLYEQYNKTWLEAEYHTTIGQSEAAKQWQYIQETKDTLPILRYSAVMDQHTSEVCKLMDGITASADHPIWRTKAPLNHYLCRCLLEQLYEGKLTAEKTLKGTQSATDAIIQPLFNNNPGITGEVFTKDHPYFDVDKSDKAFARKNFGLPIPKKD